MNRKDGGEANAAAWLSVGAEADDCASATAPTRTAPSIRLTAVPPPAPTRPARTVRAAADAATDGNRRHARVSSEPGVDISEFLVSVSTHFNM